MAEFGSSDSGASLGDILGAAISKAAQERDAAGSEKPKPAKGSKKKPEAKAEDDTPDDGEADDA